jgi:hypothetical protein
MELGAAKVQTQSGTSCKRFAAYSNGPKTQAISIMTLRLVCLSRDQRQKGDHVWTDGECAAFEARWPRGTRERLAF